MSPPPWDAKIPAVVEREGEVRLAETGQERAFGIGRAAYWGLFVLTFINLFNYLDRFVLSALVESIKADLGLSDSQIGWLHPGFVIVYMVTAPLFGWLGDRGSRKGLVAAGVAIWSVSTALGGFAGRFATLFGARASVGIGEAAYGTIAPAMLADYFPKRLRGRIFAVFFLAIPVGSALGYMLGGYVASVWGWREAFFIAGVPGILLAVLMLTVKEPLRGLHDEPNDKATEIRGAQAYSALSRNRPFVITVAGYAAYTFALGGLAFWMPAFLERVRGVEKSEATVQFGAIIVVTGIIGTFAGGFLADWLLKKLPESYLWVSGIATVLAAPFALVALTSTDPTLYLGSLVLAEILIFMSTGPVNSAIVDVVPPSMRATAVAVSIFGIHIFGDVPSPPLIGALSDDFGLGTALLLIPLATLVSGVIWCSGALDARRVRRANAGS